MALDLLKAVTKARDHELMPPPPKRLPKIWKPSPRASAQIWKPPPNSNLSPKSVGSTNSAFVPYKIV